MHQDAVALFTWWIHLAAETSIPKSSRKYCRPPGPALRQLKQRPICVILICYNNLRKGQVGAKRLNGHLGACLLNFGTLLTWIWDKVCKIAGMSTSMSLPVLKIDGIMIVEKMLQMRYLIHGRDLWSILYRPFLHPSGCTGTTPNVLQKGWSRTSIQLTTVPSRWKETTIIPWYASIPRSYRPIFLTRCICKLMKKWWTSYWHGFKKRKTCRTHINIEDGDCCT